MENNYAHLNKTYIKFKTFFDPNGFASISTLSVAETEFAYYMSMAAIAGYPIALFQLSPYSETLGKIADYLIRNPHETNPIQDQLRIYWFYLFANYGCHDA